MYVVTWIWKKIITCDLKKNMEDLSEEDLSLVRYFPVDHFDFECVTFLIMSIL